MSTKLSVGIVGLPNVGKSTLFNALTSKVADAQNYPFCTIEPNVGVVDLPDSRLRVLSDISASKKIIPATMTFVDIAGLVEGASKGEGLGNKFLSNIRETDAICHVVRCFEDADITHVSQSLDPIRDIEVINMELILADLQMAQNVHDRVAKQSRGNKEKQAEIATLAKIREHLDEGKSLRSLELSEDELPVLKEYPFLTMKKVLYLCNVGEDDLPEMENAFVEKVRAFAKAEGNSALTICAKLEEEISQLPAEEQGEFLETLGLEESGLSRLIRTGFDMLGLITFLTTGEMETRAWPIRMGTMAPDAAGKIHTDIMEGFIKAEVVKFQDMVTYKGRNGAKDQGLLQIVGRDYVVEDGDVILFHHHK